MSTASNRTRQAAELILLQTMYPAEFIWRSTPPAILDPTPDLSNTIDPEEADTLPDTPDPSITLTLHPASYSLDITLPPSYPSTQNPLVYLSCGGDVPTATRKATRAALSRIVETQEVGVEVLDLIVTGFLDELPALTASCASGSKDADVSETEDLLDQQRSQPIKRVVIWSHHLLATSKRRDIQAWSKELQLGGYARPGYPGAVFAEGEEAQVDEFVRRLKQLRWQALQVRAEESAEARACGPGDDGVREVEGLGDIAERLRVVDADVATLFLEGMKIAGGGGSSGGH